MKLFRKAILIIHGFSGGTFDEEYLAHQLELIPMYDVYSFTLPGHDGDFTEKVTRERWIETCEQEVKFLINNGYNEIYVIGHSMGGILATLMANKYKEIKKLVLVAPAFRFFGYENGFMELDHAVKKAPKILEDYGTSVIANKVFKMPLSCFIEFIKLVSENQDVVKEVAVPTLIIRGLDDEVVPEESVIHVFQNIKTKEKKLMHLKKATHDVFKGEQKEDATKAIISFFKNTANLYLISNEK